MSDKHHSNDFRVPVINIWDFLLVPLQGDITDGQADAMRQSILARIETLGSKALIVDASGLVLVDSHLCALLADLARSAKLMGARTILSGLDPNVAQTLMEMGIVLTGIDCVMSLEQAFKRVGIRYQREGAAEGKTLMSKLLKERHSEQSEVKRHG